MTTKTSAVTRVHDGPSLTAKNKSIRCGTFPSSSFPHEKHPTFPACATVPPWRSHTKWALRWLTSRPDWLIMRRVPSEPEPAPSRWQGKIRRKRFFFHPPRPLFCRWALFTNWRHRNVSLVSEVGERWENSWELPPVIFVNSSFLNNGGNRIFKASRIKDISWWCLENPIAYPMPSHLSMSRPSFVFSQFNFNKIYNLNSALEFN